jgi:acyl-coenzyme A synthetase/AMP-(fatty) acid ligase
MNTALTIADLLGGPLDPARVVARCGKAAITLAQFRADVAANAAALGEGTCRRGLLITADTYWAAVGVCALFQIGAEVVLPQNVTVGACDAIRAYWDVLVCDRLPAGHAGGFVLRSAVTDSAAKLRAVDPAQCRLALFTSGSTGAPKRVDKTLAVMERESAAVEAILGATVPAQAFVTGSVTHQHLFGLAYKLFWPLCTGRTIDGRVHDLWESMLVTGIADAAVITSPPHLTRLGSLDALAPAKRPACLLSAGAELPEAACHAAGKTFSAPICEIYGSTETGTIGWRWRQGQDEAWQPMPGVAIRTDSDGILAVDSPFLPDAGWHATSDRAEIDGSGGFRLKGRIDRIAKIEGKRVSLSAVEAALAASPDVAAVKVIALPDDTHPGGIVLGAVVVPGKAGAAALIKLGSFRFGRQLRQFLGASQEAAAMPKRWRFVDALPADRMGKVRQEDLAALFAQESQPREPALRAVRRDGNEVELDLYNPADLIQLDGHFPHLPIVPGVAQIDWAVKFAARYLDLPIEAATDYQVKFHRLTLPQTEVTLKLAHDPERRRLSFSYRRGADMLTSGTIRLATP